MTSGKGGSSPASSRWWKLVKRASSGSSWRKPGFSGSWVDRTAPLRDPQDAKENRYNRIELYSSSGGSDRLYMVDPYEYRMKGEEASAAREGIERLLRTPPPPSILDDERRIRRYTERLAERFLGSSGADLGSSGLQVLTRICAQYSSGFGTIEHLLRDERVQDLYVDSPPEDSPVYVTLGGGMDPELEGTYPTNIYLTADEMERIVSILRYHSDRPFSEANPVLECDMEMHRARATAVGPPLSPAGLSLAIRKHSHDPWTIARLVSAGALSPDAAGFFNLCLEGNSTVLVAGPRGAGKTSLLGGLLFEIDRCKRIITIEDTPELPAEQLRSCGYKVLSLLIGDGGSQTAEKALRTALRLGESVLVLGEVRGPETRTLYEAMSAGTAGSSVLGTFHADSARAVYKRVVDDLSVPGGSFQATDLVVITGLIRPQGRRTTLRRVVQVAEVVKEGEPGRFNDLYAYDPVRDRLAPVGDLRSSIVIGRIARLWGWNPSDVVAEIAVRGSLYERIGRLSSKADLSRASTTARMLDRFREVREEAVADGWVHDGKRLIDEWEEAFQGGWD